MEILIKRIREGKDSTLGAMKVDGMPNHFILEDTDRGLDQSMPLDEIQKLKVKGRTAIPTGRYQITVTHSPRFGRMMPILLNVPGYSGIRIHSGNRHEHTDGCLLPGRTYNKVDEDYMVFSSRSATEQLYDLINAALKRGEKIWITIQRNY